MELVDSSDLESDAERRAGSNPASAIYIMGQYPKFGRTERSAKPLAKAHRGFESRLSFHNILARLASGLSPYPFKVVIVGSNPIRVIKTLTAITHTQTQKWKVSVRIRASGRSDRCGVKVA